MKPEYFLLAVSSIGVVLMYLVILEEREINKSLCHMLSEKNKHIADLELKYIHCANCDREIKEHCDQLTLDLDYYEERCKEAEIRLDILKSKYEMLEAMCPVNRNTKKSI